MPIARAALTIPGITPEDIRITTRTLLAAAKLSAKEVAQEIEMKRDVVKDLKNAQKEVIPAYAATLDLLRNLDVKILKQV
jgi:predicted DNA-binding protein YlxM (UPF0122 family)